MTAVLHEHADYPQAPDSLHSPDFAHPPDCSHRPDSSHPVDFLHSSYLYSHDSLIDYSTN
jgi:hypothetical protein